MYIHIHICVYDEVYVCLYTYIHVCIYIRVYTYVYIHIYVYVYTYTYMCIRWGMCMFIYIYSYVYSTLPTVYRLIVNPIFCFNDNFWQSQRTLPSCTFIHWWYILCSLAENRKLKNSVSKLRSFVSTLTNSHSTRYLQQVMTVLSVYYCVLRCFSVS